MLDYCFLAVYVFAMASLLKIFNPEQIIIPNKGKAPTGKGLFPWLWYFISPYKKSYIFLTVFMITRDSVMLSLPLFSAKIVEMFETGRAYENTEHIWLLFTVFSFIIVFSYSLVFILSGISNLMDLTSRSLSLHSLNHLLGLSIDWHELSGSGGKLQRVLKARESMKNLIEQYFWTILPYIGLSVSLTASILLVETPVVFILFFFLYISSYIGVILLTMVWLKQGHRKHNETMEAVVGKVYEFLNSVATVKAFTMGKFLTNFAKEEEYKSHLAWRWLITKNYTRWTFLNMLAAFWTVLIIGMGIHFVLNGQMSYSSLALVSFLSLTVVWERLEVLAREIGNIIEHMTGIERLVFTLNHQNSFPEKPGAPEMKDVRGRVSFNQVCFTYKNEKTVLSDLSLEIAQGEKVGLIGPSGAGKTTLVKLLLRLYDPDDGSVQIDGKDLRDVELDSLRKNIAIIPQDVALFNHPVSDNIRYGRMDASDDEVINAAKKAHAHEFIKDLHDGYGTIVGERGVKLSGGQRQRIAIARAILKNAPILVLDEATSALDSESEMLIQESLKELMQGKTVLAIAHRLSTIAHLDRLVVMDQGRIIEDGSHDALLARNGLYAKLWNMQSGGFISK